MNHKNTDRIASTIYQAPLGQYVGRGGAEALARYVSAEVPVADGEFLFHRGDRADTFYLVTSGKLAVVREATRQRPELVSHRGVAGVVAQSSSPWQGAAHSPSSPQLASARPQTTTLSPCTSTSGMGSSPTRSRTSAGMTSRLQPHGSLHR